MSIINMSQFLGVVPMIDYNRLASANDQALEYDVELSIITQKYVQIYQILYGFVSTKI